jgi:transposase-like protein
MGDIITLNKLSGDEMTKSRRTFSREFKLEATQLVVDLGYTVRAACGAVGVGKSTMEYWVRQLRAERQGKSTGGSALRRHSEGTGYPSSIHPLLWVITKRTNHRSLRRQGAIQPSRLPQPLDKTASRRR